MRFVICCAVQAMLPLICKTSIRPLHSYSVRAENLFTGPKVLGLAACVQPFSVPGCCVLPLTWATFPHYHNTQYTDRQQHISLSGFISGPDWLHCHRLANTANFKGVARQLHVTATAFRTSPVMHWH